MAMKVILAALAVMVAAPAFAGSYTQTNLVSDGSIQAAVKDPNLVNAWGISYSPTGDFWVSDNATGLTTLYNGSGAIVPLVVSIPAAGGSSSTGTPTGQVYNGGSGFVVKSGTASGPSVFMFATEDGTISGWNPNVNGTASIVAVDNSKSNAVYKGIALYTDKSGKSSLLAADFHNNEIAVFDDRFRLAASFTDKTLPKGYAPYNVQVLNNAIYVTYAKQDKAKHDSISGPGLGAVEQIDITGKVLASFKHGKLNAPWGLAIAPTLYGKFGADLLVGNFGDGRITAFTSSLKQAGQLKTSSGSPVAIDGLWGLIIGNGGQGGNSSEIYFSAGPHGETEGLFGSLSYMK